MSTEIVDRASASAVPVESASPQKTRTRPEIQALRAIAVLAVVTYHLWPAAVTGGYVGVDVFFVISGFLITSHLLREVSRTGRITLASFWARRARRLLPASLLVIAVSIIATVMFVPTVLWAQFLSEFRASALYFQNWLLAGNSVDYLASDNSPSPVQHYWSLSVEEQFYLAWPLIILFAIAIASRVRRFDRDRTIAVVLGVVTLVSLAYCVYETPVDPGPAYFSTAVRGWEFGLGGLLAILIRNQRPINARWREAISIVGLAAIIFTVFSYDAAVHFPGWRALLPTLGTAAVIFAGSPETAISPIRLLGIRPIQWLGDVSYSLYLWHWPPIVLLPFILHTALTWYEIVEILLGSVALAWLTRRFVEDPVRRGRWLNRRSAYVTLGLTAVAMIVVATTTTVTTHVQDQAITAAVKHGKAVTKPGTPCLGAAAVDPANQPCVNPKLKGLVLPDAAAGQRDWVIPPWDNCRTGVYSTKVLQCTFAKGTGKRVALIGDSHAEHWLPALTIIAKAQGWTLTTFLKGGCPFSAAVRTDNKSTSLGSCTPWRKSVQKKIVADHINLVITSQTTGTTFAHKSGQTSLQAGAQGLAKLWTVLQGHGIQVVAIRDVPQMPRNVPTCLSELGSNAYAEASQCEGQERTALKPDPQIEAAKESGAGLIVLTDYFCQHSVCPALIGSEVVYRDTAHLGGAFSRSLSPFIYAQLSAYLKSKGDSLASTPTSSPTPVATAPPTAPATPPATAP